MSDPWAQLKDLDRKLLAQAWKGHRKGLPLEGELRDLGWAMAHHAEWSPIWDNLATAQDTGVEILEDGHPVNLLLHVLMDSIIKRQLDADDPEEIKSVYQHLESQGFEEFDAIHILARALVGEMWEIMNRQRPFDRTRYVA